MTRRIKETSTRSKDEVNTQRKEERQDDNVPKGTVTHVLVRNDLKGYTEVLNG
jgi:hypothetical protein